MSLESQDVYLQTVRMGKDETTKSAGKAGSQAMGFLWFSDGIYICIY